MSCRERPPPSRLDCRNARLGLLAASLSLGKFRLSHVSRRNRADHELGQGGLLPQEVRPWSQPAFGW
jgi:hypothetical protein